MPHFKYIGLSYKYYLANVPILLSLIRGQTVAVCKNVLGFGSITGDVLGLKINYLKCAECRVQCAVCTVHCAVHSVQYDYLEVYILQYVISCTHCTWGYSM